MRLGVVHPYFSVDAGGTIGFRLGEPEQQGTILRCAGSVGKLCYGSFSSEALQADYRLPGFFAQPVFNYDIKPHAG